MALMKAGQIVPDPWVRAGDADPLPDDGRPALVSLARWQAERTALDRHNGPLGIVLQADQPPALIADALDRFDLVALTFPRFNDGRAYSYARILRTRLGFGGEIRAVGDVLRDQIPFMLRCGFDGFEVKDADAADAWQGTAEIGIWYQKAADARTPVAVLRHNAAPNRRPPAPERRALRQPAAAPVPLVKPCCAGDWAY